MPSNRLLKNIRFIRISRPNILKSILQLLRRAPSQVISSSTFRKTSGRKIEDVRKYGEIALGKC